MALPTIAPDPEHVDEEGLASAIPHAALQINAANGSTIRVYRMYTKHGTRVVAERLRPESLKIWDVIEEACTLVENDDLIDAFSLSLGKLAPYLWPQTVR